MSMNPKPKSKRREKRTQQDASRTVVKSNTQRSTQKKVQENTHISMLSQLGIELNSETAKKAIILSEIIGPPVAKRNKMK